MKVSSKKLIIWFTFQCSGAHIFSTRFRCIPPLAALAFRWFKSNMFNGNICAHKLILRGRREHVLPSVYILFLYDWLRSVWKQSPFAFCERAFMDFSLLCTNAAAATMPVRVLTVYFIVTGVADLRAASVYTLHVYATLLASTSFSQNKSARAESEFK